MWRLGITACAVLVILGLISSQGSGATRLFPDVAMDHPYALAIVDLADRAIINGYSDGMFGPQNRVLRQQFARMLVSTLGLAVSEADRCPFVDVDVGGPETLYPDNYIAVAASRGIVLGTAPGLFSPGGNLTRAQMVSMIVRAIDSLADGPLPAPRGEDVSTWGRFDPQHDSNARWAESEGLLVGLPLEILDPEGFATRGEVAQVLHNLDHDVRYYGAKGDGVTNDAAAIQNAVDAAASAGGTVTFPAGTFVVNATIYLKSGISVVGTPGQTILTMPPKSAVTFILSGTGLSNVTLDGLTFRASSYGDNVSGFYMVGAKNCQARNLRFENLDYGMKLGSGPVASGWIIEDIVARNCRDAIYASYVEDSSFARLDLQAAHIVGTNQYHTIYLERELHRVTFTDVTLAGGSGYSLHLYIGSGGTSSDLLFENLVLDATTGRRPLYVGSGWSNVSFSNLTMKSGDGSAPCVVLGSAQDITFDGFTASGGQALVDTSGGVSPHASRITFRNGTYDGSNLPVADPEIDNLVYVNVTLGSPTTTTILPVATTTTLPSTTTITHAPVTTTTTLPSTTLPSTTTITHAPVTTTTNPSPGDDHHHAAA
jgi:Pectate lyase superfamily protein/S-layer homology domain